ncbi:SEC-C metal-binding domain-containing protein, partial [Pseudomonas aeruginosa]|uniref:SEC-C metal-binding domain-containing protein n=1 Tax=Pseudomonas aeruginosa TaxID=287 RepID=UPI001FB841E3
YQALSRDVLLEDYLGLRRQLARAGLDDEARERLAGMAARYQALSRDVLLEDYLGLRRQLARAGLDDETRERLAGMAARLESWLALGGRGDQACPCGSGKRYRNCCSRLVASAS